MTLQRRPTDPGLVLRPRNLDTRGNRRRDVGVLSTVEAALPDAARRLLENLLANFSRTQRGSRARPLLRFWSRATGRAAAPSAEPRSRLGCGRSCAADSVQPAGARTVPPLAVARRTPCRGNIGTPA